MPSHAQRTTLKTKLGSLARGLPRGGELVFHVEDDHVWLHKIHLPASARGQGTALLASVLSATDQAGLSVCLTADPMPSDEDAPKFSSPTLSEPDTFHLVRWYTRFGFVSYGPSEDGFLMQRPADLSKPSTQGIMSSYLLAKQKDLTLAEFSKWESKPSRSSGP